MLSVLMNQSGDPISFDLHQESGSATMETAGPIYENLVAFDAGDPTKIVGELAESWSFSADGRTMSIALRKGVRFQNGDAFTSADAKFSLERVISPPRGVVSPRGPAFAAVDRIDAPDEYTLRITLKRPNSSLIANLAQGWMAVYSKKWVEAKSQDIPKTELNGTGPFRLKTYLPGNNFEVERSADYWRFNVPYLDGVKTLIVPDFSTRVAAFRTGQVHIERLFAADAKQLKTDLGQQITVVEQSAPSFGALYMNTRRAPFDNPLVRQAVNLAVDRYQGVQVLAQGGGDIGGYMMPGGAWALPTEEIAKLPGYAKDKAPDIAKAIDLLKQAGYPSGFPSDLVTRTGQTNVATATLMQDQLKKIGISATIVPIDSATATGRANAGEFQLLTWGHEFALDDPDAVYGEFYACDGVRNWSRLCSSEFDALYQQQSQELDPFKRHALVQQMERLGIPLGGKIVTHWNHRIDGMWSYVKNYVQHPSPFTNVRYREVWLDK